MQGASPILQGREDVSAAAEIPAPAPDAWVIQAQFADLAPCLVGEPRQFLVAEGAVHCVRAHPLDPRRENPALDPCTGCPHHRRGCEIAGEASIQASVVPNARRGIGFEERPFLVLRFRPGHGFATLPRRLWDSPFADRAMHEANLHGLLVDSGTARLHTFKGQLRWYGTPAAFAASEHAAYLDVFDAYAPCHAPVSLDYNAYEARMGALVLREPAWLRVFEGTPKIVFREVALDGVPAAEVPRTVHAGADGRRHCVLSGEIARAEFALQCAACPVQARCRVVADHHRAVPGDFHAVNAEGLYGSEFTAAGAAPRTRLRKIAKEVGLALSFGGTACAVAAATGTSREEAQARIDAFFARLPVLRRSMRQRQAHALRTGQTVNPLGRRRDLRPWTHAAPLDRAGRLDIERRGRLIGFARRTALNHPAQSLAADLLKLAMIRLCRLAAARRWNPLAGMAPPRRLAVGAGAYRSLRMALASSIHDEAVTLVHDDARDAVVPEVHAAMQLPDVMAALQAGFGLELDCAHDRTRSWTATEPYGAARISLMRHLGESA